MILAAVFPEKLEGERGLNIMKVLIFVFVLVFIFLLFWGQPAELLWSFEFLIWCYWEHFPCTSELILWIYFSWQDYRRMTWMLWIIWDCLRGHQIPKKDQLVLFPWSLIFIRWTQMFVEMLYLIVNFEAYSFFSSSQSIARRSVLPGKTAPVRKKQHGSCPAFTPW